MNRRHFLSLFPLLSVPSPNLPRARFYREDIDRLNAAIRSHDLPAVAAVMQATLEDQTYPTFKLKDRIHPDMIVLPFTTSFRGLTIPSIQGATDVLYRQMFNSYQSLYLTHFHYPKVRIDNMDMVHDSGFYRVCVLSLVKIVRDW